MSSADTKRAKGRHEGLKAGLHAAELELHILMQRRNHAGGDDLPRLNEAGHAVVKILNRIRPQLGLPELPPGTFSGAPLGAVLPGAGPQQPVVLRAVEPGEVATKAISPQDAVPVLKLMPKPEIVAAPSAASAPAPGPSPVPAGA